MQNRIVEWNPSHESNQFVVGNSTKIELLEFQSDKPIIKKYKDIYTHPHAVQSVICTCLNWHPDQRPNQSIIAYGTSIGEVKALNWSSNIELTIHNPVAASRRVCTSVAWNVHYQRYIAAGFEKSRSLNEFCAVVWDIEHTENVLDPITNEMVSNTAVVFKPMSDEPISSVCWLSDYNVLAIGTSLSFVRLYDIRIRPTAAVVTVNELGASSHSSSVSASTAGAGPSSTGTTQQYTSIQQQASNSAGTNASAEILSLQAHVATRPRKIKGIRQDPFNDYSIATFSDAVLESIKVWDLRKIASTPKPKLVINPYEHSAELSSVNSSGMPRVNSTNDTNQVFGSSRQTVYPPTGAAGTSSGVSGSVPSSVTVGGRFSNFPSSAYTNSYTNTGMGSAASASPLSSSGLAQNACVIDIAWSTTRTNLLAVATSHQKCLSFYSTSKVPPDNYTKVPLYTIPVADSIKCFAWLTSSSYADNKRRSAVSSAPLSGTSATTGLRSSLNSNLTSLHGSSATATSAATADSSNATSAVPSVSLFTYNDFSTGCSGTAASATTGKPQQSTARHQLLVATQSRYLDIHVVDSLGLSMGPDDSLVAANGTHIRLCKMSKQHHIHSSNQLNSMDKSVPRSTQANAAVTATKSAVAEMNHTMTNNSTHVTAVPSIEHIMKFRCHIGYSLDTGRNLQILSDELDRFESLLDSSLSSPEISSHIRQNSSTGSTSSGSRLTAALLQKEQQEYKNSISTLISVWSWLHRVETLQNEHSHSLYHQQLYPTSGSSGSSHTAASTQSLLSLRTCGILQLIQQQVFPQPVPQATNPPTASVANTAATAASTSSQSVFHRSLGTVYYRSAYRCLARSICGWTSDIFDKADTFSSSSSQSMSSFNRASSSSASSATLATAGTRTSMSSSYHTEIAEDDDDDDDDEVYESDTTATATTTNSVGPSRRQSSNSLNTSQKKRVNTNSDKDQEKEKENADQPDEELENLLIILHDCAVVGNFERAAALALFNGHLELSVNILQTSYNTISEFKQTFSGVHTPAAVSAAHAASNKAHKPSTHTQSHSTRAKSLSNGFFDTSGIHTRFHSGTLNMDAVSCVEDDEEEERLIAQCQDMSMEYLHCISLVAMCLAGYTNPIDPPPPTTTTTTATGHVDKAAAPNSHRNPSMWVSMCHLILSHLSQVSEERPQSVCYLTAMCHFLLENVSTPAAAGSHDKSRSPLLSEIPAAAAAKSGHSVSSGDRVDKSKVSFSGLYKYPSIILNDSLGLEDRVAFACSYLDDHSLQTWLKSLYQHSSQVGNLRGLIVTGLGTEGMEIIQSYIDKYFDIQTAALIVGRIVDVAKMPSTAGALVGGGDSAKDSSNKQRVSGGIASSSSHLSLAADTSSSSSAGVVSLWQVEVVWLNEYRGLLNRWRYFFARASLDVALGKLFRINKTRQENSTNTANAKKAVGAAAAPGRGTGGPTAAGKAGGGGGGSGNKLMYSLPPHRNLDSPHIALRCHYCSTSLPVDPMQQNQTTLSFLRKQKPVINCCPHCKKQLPRCYVCLLYMGVMNPNTEFNRMMAIRRLNSENAMLMKNATDVPSTPTASGSAAVGVSVTGAVSAVAGGGIGESASAEDSFEHNALEYGQWFYFCQRCRHGGHASCIETWFSSTNDGKQQTQSQQSLTAGRSVCGVSGCACKCQYWR